MLQRFDDWRFGAARKMNAWSGIKLFTVLTLIIIGPVAVAFIIDQLTGTKYAFYFVATVIVILNVLVLISEQRRRRLDSLSADDHKPGVHRKD
jgi:uncharacterized membrane protein YoaK (UPF0700 family)